MDSRAHLAALEADSGAIAELAPQHLERAVPACPDWDVADLIGHLGGVYSWAAMVTSAGGDRPQGERDRPPPDREALIRWFQVKRQAVLSVLAGTDPDRPAWVFIAPSPRNVAWWRRRQAMETAIHLADVQQAAGITPTMSAELAADGIDEVLTEMLPGLMARRRVEGLGGTLHVHCTDAEGEWVLDFSAPTLEVRREHAKADTAARGPAAGLYLWLWNRTDPESAGLDVFGDQSLVETWRKVRL